MTVHSWSRNRSDDLRGEPVVPRPEHARRPRSPRPPAGSAGPGSGPPAAAVSRAPPDRTTSPACSRGGPMPESRSVEQAAQHRLARDAARHGEVADQPARRGARGAARRRRPGRRPGRAATSVLARPRRAATSGAGAPVTATTRSVSARTRSPPAATSSAAAAGRVADEPVGPAQRRRGRPRPSGRRPARPGRAGRGRRRR